MRWRVVLFLFYVTGCLSGCGGQADPPPSAITKPVSPALPLLQGISTEQSPSVSTDPKSQPAVLRGEVHKTDTLGTATNWQKVPDFLDGLKIQRLPMDRKGSGAYKIQIDSPGVVLVAARRPFKPANFYEDPSIVRKGLEQLTGLGWERLATIILEEDNQLLNCDVFRKEVRQGEELLFPTSVFGGPQLILLETSHVDKLAKVKTVQPSANELTHLPVVPRVAGTAAKNSGRQLLLSAHDAHPSAMTTALLQRELIRQALWMAADEELGLATRDGFLRESFPEGDSPAGLPWDVIASSEPTSKQIVATVFRHTPEAYDVIWNVRFPIDYPVRLEVLTTTCEGWARKEFKELLLKHGFQSQERAIGDKINLPSDLESRLLNFNPIAQFGLIRNLHSVRRRQGENLNLLCALARAYANLGSTTDFLYSNSYRVYQARALLYAERARVKFPNDIGGIWTRAYVRAVLGLHLAALSDIRTAGDMHSQPNDKVRLAKQPGWIPVLKSFCEFKRPELQAAESNTELFALSCHLQLLSQPYRMSDQRRWKVAMRLHEIHPQHLLAGHSMSRNTPLGIQGQPRLPDIARAVAEGIAEMSDAPEEIRKLCASALREVNEDAISEILGSRGRLQTLLLKADDQENDTATPAWSALVALIRELTFEAGMSSVVFQDKILGVDAGDTVKQLQTLVEGHPYILYLQSGLSDPKKRKDAATQLLKQLEPEHLSPATLEMLYWVKLATPDRDKIDRLLLAENYHHDQTFGDVADFLNRSTWSRNAFGKEADLPAISPHAPEMAIFTLYHTSKELPPEAEFWEQRYASEPEVQHELAKAYMRTRLWADAERCLKREIQLVASPQARQALATVYESQKMGDEAIKTLEEGLNDESFGLEHAQIEMRLAEMLMDQKRWKEALPHAKGAAASYSSWGLRCAQNCYEELGDLEEAEKLVQARSERYQGDAMEWYFWCRRTGRGDLNAAQKVAEQLIQHVPDPVPEGFAWRLMTYQVLTDDPDAALKTCADASKRHNSAGLSLQAALLAATKGSMADCQSFIQQATVGGTPADRFGKVQNAVPQFALCLAEFIKTSNVAELEKVAEFISKDLGYLQTDIDTVHYFAGRFLWQYQHHELAIKHLRTAANSDRDSYFRVLATVFLNQEKVDLTIPKLNDPPAKK